MREPGTRKALVLTVPTALLMLVSCTAAPPTASPSTGATPRAPSPTITATTTPVATTAAPTQQPTAPAPTPTAVATTEPLSAAEVRLVQELRPDARVRCSPRRTELPAKATAAVECRVNTALVDRVGVYGFFSTSGGTESVPAGSGLAAYLARLRERGVAPKSGDCAAGRPGDRSWPANLPDEGDGGPYRETRSGCFRDVNGNANVRLTCYNEIYIGIVGKTRDIAALYRWAWQVPRGQSTQRDPPGICDRPD